MSYEIDDEKKVGHPVVKRTAIGQHFIGAIIDKPLQRDMLKDGEPVLKDNGKPRQELVVHLIALPGTTAPAGIGETVAVPAPGDIVRMILRGGGFGDWIEAKNAMAPRRLTIGDIVEQTVTHGQVYDAGGKVIGPKLTTQAQIDAVPRHQVLGIYGDLSIRAPRADEAKWVAAAEDAYLARKAIVIDDDTSRVSPFD